MAHLIERLNDVLGDRYRIERELGAGGMATVFLADDLKHDRKVAIKVLHPELAASIGAERFLGEIRTMARLQHPHILPLLDSGEADGLLYYVMPYVRGESLRGRLSRGPMPADEAISVLRDLLRALQYAHDEGILHRDVKPENVLLSSGTAVLADLGIAKALSAATATVGSGASLTVTGTSIGTPAYMAPEQAAADPSLDGRADLYAWGLVAWEMLAGHHPFASARSPHAMLTAQFSEVPQPLAQVAAVDVALSEVVQRTLAKTPEARYANAGDTLNAFDAALRSGASGERVVAAPRRPALWRVPVFAGGALVLAILVWWLRGFAVPRRDAAGPVHLGTVAVIPVTGSVNDGAASYLTDGIVDDLTSLLQSEPTLRVINRASAFALRGRALDLAKVSAQLGVDHVVQVSGRALPSGYRLVVDLVDVSSGVVQWSRQFEAPRDSVSTLPPRVAGRLMADFGQRGAPVRATAHAPSPAAYDAYLRGRFFRQRLSQPTDVDSARYYLFKAADLDPQFAAPFAVLATLYVEISGSLLRVPEAYAMADSMAARAVTLDPRNAEALAVRGWSALVRRWDWESSARDLEAAVKADPNSGSIRFLRMLDRTARADFSGALADARTGAQRDPLYPTNWFVRIYLENALGNVDSAFAALRHLDAIAPRFVLISSNSGELFRARGQLDSALNRDTIADHVLGSPTAGTALTLLALGRRAEAEAHYRRMRDAYRAKPMLPESMARVASALGWQSEALDWLEVAADERSDLLFFWMGTPEFRPLAKEPRFLALLNRAKAPASLRKATGAE